MLVQVGSNLSVQHEQVVATTGVDDDGAMSHHLEGQRIIIGRDGSTKLAIMEIARAKEANPAAKSLILLQNTTIIASDWEVDKIIASVNAPDQKRMIFYQDIGELPAAKVDEFLEKVKERLNKQGVQPFVIVPVRSHQNHTRIETLP